MDNQNFPSDQELRTPPHNDEAEVSLLGSVFLNNRVLDEVAGIVAPDDFYRESHRHIYRAMHTLYGRGDVVDVITLADFLKAEKHFEAAGGGNYLARLSQDVPSSAHVTYYATIVGRKAQLRRLIIQMRALQDECYGDVSDFESFMSGAQATLLESTRVSSRDTEVRHISQGTTSALEYLQERIDAGGNLLGISTGIKSLDDLTGGLIPSRLWIIGGRPGMGKTALATTIQANLAAKGHASMFVSLEMDEVQFSLRHLCLEAKVDSQKILNLNLDADELARLGKADATLRARPVYYHERSGLTHAEVCQVIRKAVVDNGVRVAFVDFIQLVHGSSPGRDSQRRLEIKAIVYALKELSKELDITVVGLSQMNRNVESRINKRPMVSDLEESGAIEQAADVILFPYRDHVYNEDAEESEAEGIIRKARDGRQGTAPLRWVGAYTAYYDPANSVYEEEADRIARQERDRAEGYTEVSFYGPGDLKK